MQYSYKLINQKSWICDRPPGGLDTFTEVTPDVGPEFYPESTLWPNLYSFCC